MQPRVTAGRQLLRPLPRRPAAVYAAESKTEAEAAAEEAVAAAATEVEAHRLEIAAADL